MYNLSYGKWNAMIVPECGANIVSLSYDGKPLLRSPESAEAFAAHPCLYGLPILLPANRVKDGVFTYQGRQYELPVNEPVRSNHIHGLLNNAPFAVLSQDDACIATQLYNDGAYYPFPFRLTFQDRLSENGFTREIALENIGVLPMPYTMAFHTTFITPSHLRVPLGKRYATDDRLIPTGEMVELQGWERACVEGMAINGQKLSGFFTSSGNAARIGDFTMTLSQQFDHWVLFNGNGNDGYLCVEPQCGAVDGLNNGRHLVLQPGKTEVFTITITL